MKPEIICAELWSKATVKILTKFVKLLPYNVINYQKVTKKLKIKIIVLKFNLIVTSNEQFAYCKILYF